MELVGEGRWKCPRTGLIVLDVPSVAAWRIFQARFRSPLNPPVRTGPISRDWSRFDIAGHATVYGAGTRRGGFIESLAYARYEPSLIPVHELFSDVAPWEDPISQEWQELSHMAPTRIPANWRTSRRIADIRLDNKGYWVDVSAAETLGALRRAAAEWATGKWLADPGLIDLAALTGSDRALTCAAAQWLSKQTPQDGRKIRGLHYISKHGADISCWALWVAIDTSQQIFEALHATASHGTTRDIREDDADLRWAATQLGLGVW
jgi:hypothetical protein